MKQILILIFFTSASIFAQDEKFQIDFGMNNGWFHFEEDFYDDQKTSFSPNFAVAAHFSLSEFGKFETSAGIKYYRLERNIEYEFNGFTSKAELNHSYFAFPFQLKYNANLFSSKLIFNLQPSYLLDSKTQVWDYYLDDYQEKDVTGKHHRIQLFVGAGIEFNFKIIGQTFGVKSLFNINPFSVPQMNWVKYTLTEAGLYLTYLF